MGRARHLRLRSRPVARPVHLHRLRRVGPPDRGDRERGHLGAPRDRHVDRRVSDRRLGAAAGGTFAIQDYNKELGSATGVPPAQIFIDAIGWRGGLFLLLIVIGAQFFCGMSSVTSNSRMIYAFSRDGALPGSAFWHKVNKRTRTPTNSIW